MERRIKATILTARHKFFLQGYQRPVKWAGLKSHIPFLLEKERG